MRNRNLLLTSVVAAIGASLYLAAWTAAEDKSEENQEAVELKIGDVVLKAPAAWKSVKPTSRIITFELHAPAAEGDEAVGRMTMMAAGGSIQSNLERWYTQFSQPDGKETKDVVEKETIKMGDYDVHLVDISGTFLGESTPRDKYRMLAAIIEAKDAHVFVKFTGPEKTIEQHAEEFHKMIKSLE